MVTWDPGALRAALQRQQSELAPIGLVLSAAAVFPPRLQPEDWRGEASRACEQLEQHLRDRLHAADHAVTAAQRDTRAALVELEAAG